MSTIKQLQIHNQCTIYDGSRLTQPIEQCLNPEFWDKENRIVGQSYGRGVTWFVRLDKGEGVLRHYRRGGLFGKIVKDHYLFFGFNQTRSLKEFALLQLLREKEVNVPKPIAAQATRSGLFYQADILIERVPNAQDVFEQLKRANLTAKNYQSIGVMVAKMHQAGVNHTDLNIHNILIDSSEDVWLIDFDKCYQQSGSSWMQSNLDRLLRSFKKEQQKANIHWQEENWQPLLQGYQSQMASQ